MDGNLFLKETIMYKDISKRKEYNAKYHKENSLEIKERKRKYRLENKHIIESKRCMKRYGITLEDKKQLIQDQNNKCLICKCVFTKINKPHVDHNHSTGKVRGILCNDCNSLLGFAKENIQILQNSINYIEVKNG